jgi:hypothetical protein
VPALIPIFIRGRLRSEEENPLVRSFINIYKPLLTWALPRRNLVMWLFAALLIVAAGLFPLQAILGMGASESAWRVCFLVVFGFVTSVTIISMTGKQAVDVRSFLLDVGWVMLATLLLAAGLRSEVCVTRRTWRLICRRCHSSRCLFKADRGCCCWRLFHYCYTWRCGPSASRSRERSRLPASC